MSNFKPRTYTPMRKKKNYNTRDNAEVLFRKLFKDCNGVKYNGQLNYLSDHELLTMINKLLIKMDCTPLTTQELEQTLSLKN